ncbi:MAG: hypothetical protein EBR86_06815 [Planctomycetia bacterium]|nr:hypothetical protein [Planctomycetia bacterium]
MLGSTMLGSARLRCDRLRGPDVRKTVPEPCLDATQAGEHLVELAVHFLMRVVRQGSRSHGPLRTTTGHRSVAPIRRGVLAFRTTSLGTALSLGAAARRCLIAARGGVAARFGRSVGAALGIAVAPWLIGCAAIAALLVARTGTALRERISWRGSDSARHPVVHHLADDRPGITGRSPGDDRGAGPTGHREEHGQPPDAIDAHGKSLQKNRYRRRRRVPLTVPSPARACVSYPHRPPPALPARTMNALPPPKFRDPALVDHGDGRRLDRLGGVLVDWPCAAATGPRAALDAWGEAVVRHTAAAMGRTAAWTFRETAPEPWQVSLPIGRATLTLHVRPAASGQVGLFLEQLPQWRWLATTLSPGARVLSLFAHSGGATLAAATAGAEVVSVDASRQATALARRNAVASGLAAHPVAWIDDDARALVARFARRGERFDAVVLDPPSWGHGPRGQAFAIDRDLAPLLADVVRLLPRSSRPPTLLLTCHSPRWTQRRLRETLATALDAHDHDSTGLHHGTLGLTSESGRRLPLGVFMRSGSPPG